VENTIKIATAGNKGEKIRSDCFVSLEITNEGGLIIDIKSKVGALYGKSNYALCLEILEFFEIKNAKLSLEDQGALPFVISARLEMAIRKLLPVDKSYISPIIPENKYCTDKERFRFSRLYLPGNTPSMILNAGIHKPDGIILDLEDSVAPEKKEEARLLVRNALAAVNLYGAERMVRINQGALGLDDLRAVVPVNVNLVLVPKCESAAQLQVFDEEIQKIKKDFGLKNPVHLMPIIESALGIENAFEIAKSSPNVVAMAIGLEDYTADLGVRRTKEGQESLYARTRLVNACKAAGIQPIDSVFSDVADSKGLKENVANSKSIGFEGMGCIHPRQIRIIQDGFAPEAEEIEKAKKIVKAFGEARAKGLGVVALGTKMIDPPVVKRAEKIISLAILLGKLPKNWQELETV
jgi:citrate lyase subunit beta / citryl-CoA lyase